MGGTLARVLVPTVKTVKCAGKECFSVCLIAAIRAFDAAAAADDDEAATEAAASEASEAAEIAEAEAAEAAEVD